MNYRNVFAKICCVSSTVLALLICSAQDSEPNAGGESWVGERYPDFCRQYGLGEKIGSGFARYQHEIEGHTVVLRVHDYVRIVDVEVMSKDSVPVEKGNFYKVIPLQKHTKWKGKPEELRTELANWIGRSHLPFEVVFGNGNLFEVRPVMIKHHSLGTSEFEVYLDRKMVIRGIRFTDDAKKDWVRLGNHADERQ